MNEQQIQQVRRFNRAVTQRVGALEDSYLRRGRPLGEARLIFETGRHGADLRALRTTLGLDSGYLSRLLRSLETQGLVRVHKQPGDARLRRVSLTPKGQAEFATYDNLSDDLAKSILAPLGATQRDRLVAAMAEVERLIRAAAIEVHADPPDSADARWCLGEYFRELAERFDAGFDPAKSNPARDQEMIPPAGLFVVARIDGEPVGCGALKRLDATMGEIKRMWTARSARGRGLGLTRTWFDLLRRNSVLGRRSLHERLERTRVDLL
ncbi:MAG: hypothetical protein QOH05_365, partial [Acetobacteraceae bacterium]|nr:hypothetical protein [Acetobacteraceae bacterium]